MLFVRPARLSDLDALERMARAAHPVLHSLPRDRRALETRVALSEDSFRAEVDFLRQRELQAPTGTTGRVPAAAAAVKVRAIVARASVSGTTARSPVAGVIAGDAVRGVGVGVAPRTGSACAAETPKRLSITGATMASRLLRAPAATCAPEFATAPAARNASKPPATMLNAHTKRPCMPSRT